jgi:3-phenylpropionate/trans-cinnamate dioxygenase ferredoxin subunit
VSDWKEACRLADLAEDEPFGATVDGMPICVIRRGERCYAFDDMCTHELARLSDGYLEGDRIECPLHQAQFDINTGKALSPPADGDINVYEARIEGDRILIKL